MREIWKSLMVGDIVVLSDEEYALVIKKLRRSIIVLKEKNIIDSFKVSKKKYGLGNDLFFPLIEKVEVPSTSFKRKIVELTSQDREYVLKTLANNF